MVVDQKNVELHSTFTLANNAFDSPDFLQSWVQLVVTLIFHTLPPHTESASPGCCRVAIVVVVSPSVSSSSPSCFIPFDPIKTNKQQQTTFSPRVLTFLGRASAFPVRFYLGYPRRGPVSRFRSTTLEMWRNHRDCHFDK